MGLVELEKNGTITVDGMSTDEQVAHLGTLGDDNLGSLNMVPTNFESKKMTQAVDQGMHRGHLKKETSVIKICFSTVLILLFIICFTGIASVVAYKFSKINVHIFPKLESYNLEQYNTSIKRCFLILSGLLIGICFIVLFVLNMVVKSRFINNYLSKVGVVFYSIFTVIVNCLLYLGVIGVFFFIVNKISSMLNNYMIKGIITENVNINTIELFKYAIVVVCVIFLVINSFSLIGIIKGKNQFVFEEEM
mgnify:CR=1 FL=1